MRASVSTKVEPLAAAQSVFTDPVVACVLPCLMAAHALVSNVHASAWRVCACLHILDSIHLFSSLCPSRSPSMEAATQQSGQSTRTPFSAELLSSRAISAENGVLV